MNPANWHPPLAAGIPSKALNDLNNRRGCGVQTHPIAGSMTASPLGGPPSLKRGGSAAMTYPRDLSPQARTRVEAEQLTAHQQFAQSKGEEPPADWTARRWDEAAFRAYIFCVFMAFAREACALGIQSTWALDRVRSEAEGFFRRFAIQAYDEDGRNRFGEKLREVRVQSFRETPEWHQFEADLLMVAERQAGIEAGPPVNDGGSRRAADAVRSPAPALTTPAPGQINSGTTPSTVKDELVELLDRIVQKRVTTQEKWARAHKIGRTTLCDWKALRLAGKPLKGKVSAEKNAEIESAIREDARTLGL